MNSPFTKRNSSYVNGSVEKRAHARRTLAFAAFLWLFCSVAWSQSQTREIEGIVRDHQGRPLSGAVVQMESVETLQVRSFRTQASGKYHFAGAFNFEDYRLHALYHGGWSKSRYLSRFNSENPAIVDLTVKTPD